jgi:hypothetical protein
MSSRVKHYFYPRRCSTFLEFKNGSFHEKKTLQEIQSNISNLKIGHAVHSSTEKTLFVAFVFAVRFNAETDNQPATDGHEKAQIHTTKNLESVCSASYYTISCIFLGFFPFFGY